MRISCGGALVEDFDYNRTHQMFEMLTAADNRNNDMIEGFGYRSDSIEPNASLTTGDAPGIAPTHYQTVGMKLCSGLMNQSKMLPLKYMGNLTIELELVNSKDDPVVKPGVDATFTTTDPNSLDFNIKNSYFMPNPCDKALDNLKNFNHSPKNDVFYAISHGVHRGKLKNRTSDDREIFIKKLIDKCNNVRFDVYGMNGVQPIWADQYFKIISNSKMGLNLSRGLPTKHYSSNRIASLMGNGLLTFIDKKTQMSDFFDNNEIIFYSSINDLSEKIKFSINLDNYIQGGLNDYLPYVNNPKIQNVAINLKGYINLVQRNSKAIQVPTSVSNYNSIPSKSFWLSVSNNLPLEIPEKVKQFKQDTLFITLKSNKSGLEKKDLAFLDLLQANDWERPIYFNNTSLNGINIDLKRNVVQEGFAYRLMPVLNPNSGSLINTELMYSNMLNNSHWRELDNENAYFSEDHRGFIMNYRSTFNTLIRNLINDGDYEKALEVINKSIELIPDKSIMYDHFSVQLVEFLLDLKIKADMDTEELANEIAEVIANRSDELLNYYFDNKIDDRYEIQKNLVSLNTLARAYSKYTNPELSKKYRDLFENNYSRNSVN